MEFRTLGRTGIEVSAIAFGAGPIPGLMTSQDQQRQRETLACALDAGVNWIDTAATYGAGQSESSLGQTLHDLDAVNSLHLATKVRLAMEGPGSIESQIRESVADSLQRLGVSRVTLLQLHNSITTSRDDEPTSLSVADVLDKGGVLETFEQLQREGLTEHIGLTAIGQPLALREVIVSGKFATVQVPYNMLNPSAGQDVGDQFDEVNYGNVIADCAQQQMGVLAIRVYAGGALAGQSPSPHTYKTKFFPLDLYERDQQRAEQLTQQLGAAVDLKEVSLRYVLSHQQISGAIVGFADAQHVRDALAYLAAGPLSESLLTALGEG